MKLFIGCPVRDRAWILPTWLDYARKACAEIGVDPFFIFIAGGSTDSTLNLIRGIGERHRIVPTNDHDDYLPHVWNDMERYERMAQLRNSLLFTVRAMEPDYFLSLDSDILIAPGVLLNLFETIESCDAVGGKLYMTPRGPFNPSYGMLNEVNGGLMRQDQEGVFPVDVIMGMKLMSPAAFDVDYVAHFQGEDVGWSLNCRYRGVKLKWDGRVPSKHVILPEMLTRPDKRVGY